MATAATSKKQDAVDEDDDIFYYIGVKASPFATDCAVFGLPPKEASALRSRFPLSPSSPNVVNGITLKGQWSRISTTPAWTVLQNPEKMQNLSRLRRNFYSRANVNSLRTHAYVHVGEYSNTQFDYEIFVSYLIG